MTRPVLFAANHNRKVLWVYEALGKWLADRGIDLALAHCDAEQEAIEKAKDADIYLAYKFPVTRRMIAALPRLKLLLASGNGYDHIDVQAATDLGVVVTNAATYNVDDVAEHSLAMILEWSCKLRALKRLCRKGEWQCGGLVLPHYRFGSQTVGLIGFGKIGRALAWRLKALGFRVLACDPYVPVNEITQRGVEPASQEEVLAASDFVSLHVHLTDETRHLLGESQLRAMKRTAYLVNTSRGMVVDETALIRALRESWIAGAALDVMAQEPPQLSNPLLAMENVLVTGHAAGTSTNGIQAWQDEWRAVIEGYLAGYWPINVVNPEVVPRIPLRKREADR